MYSTCLNGLERHLRWSRNKYCLSQETICVRVSDDEVVFEDAFQQCSSRMWSRILNFLYASGFNFCLPSQAQISPHRTERSSGREAHREKVRRPHLHRRRHRPTTATMPQEVKQKSGIATGLNRGHVRPPRISRCRTRPSGGAE